MEVTALAEACATGDSKAAANLLPRVYNELRRLAHSYMKSERPGHTLQPTALVHEAYARLVDNARISWHGKTHFFAVAATEMRRVLVEHARSHHAVKRGGDTKRVTLQEGLVAEESVLLDALDLDEALQDLSNLSPRQARVAELRFFAGMKIGEVASFLEVSERTVKEDWRIAKAWLQRRLSHTKESRREPGPP